MLNVCMLPTEHSNVFSTRHTWLVSIHLYQNHSLKLFMTRDIYIVQSRIDNNKIQQSTLHASSSIRNKRKLPTIMRIVFWLLNFLESMACMETFSLWIRSFIIVLFIYPNSIPVRYDMWIEKRATDSRVTKSVKLMAIGGRGLTG